MRDQGTYNMSEARTSPDYSYKKCIYWMIIALLTCCFIAICVIAAIGYTKPTKGNYKGKQEPLFKDNNKNFVSNSTPSIATKKIGNPTPATTTTTIKVDYKLNEKEENEVINKILEQERNELKNSIQVGSKIDVQSNDKEGNQENDKNWEKDVQSNNEERNQENDKNLEEETISNEIKNFQQVNPKIEVQSNDKEGNQENDKNLEEETISNEIKNSKQVGPKIDVQSNDKEEKHENERNVENQTEYKIFHPDTTTEKIKISTNDELLKTSMPSSKEDLIYSSTERSFSDATELVKKATNFVKEFFAATTTESSYHSLSTEMATEPNVNKFTETTTDSSCETKIKVCSSNACKKSASRMLALIDHSVDPCNDFYKFSCGGMKINHMDKEAEENFLGIDFDELPNDNYSYSSIFKTYYDSCVIFDPKYPANPVTLKKIYLDRMVEGLKQDNSELNDLTDLIGNIILSHPYGSSSRLMPLFDVVMDIGPDGKYVPVLTVPLSVSDIFEADTGDIYEQFCLKDSEKFAKTEKSAKNIHDNYMICLNNQTMYLENLRKAITQLNIFDHLEDPQKISQKTEDVIWKIEFDVVEELGLIRSQEKLKELRSTYNSPQYYDMQKLNMKYTKINWNRLFKKLFAIEDVSNLSVKVMFPGYLDKIFKFIEETNFEDLKSILIAMSAHDMYVHYIRPNTICDREKYCKKLVINVLGDIATNMYLKKMNKKDYLHKENVAHKLFDQISNEYISAINNVSWLENLKKENFTNTIKSIKLVTNVDLLEKGEARLQDKYNSTGELSLCFITNNDIFKHLKRKTMYTKLDINGDDPKNLWDFQIDSLKKLPITITPLKIIVLPFNVLDNTVPRNRESLQNYETYSKLGFMLSREIASFFNPTNIKNTDASDNADYKDFVDVKLSDPKITQTENNLKINLDKDGILFTLDSRFSDDSALRLSYETYMKLESSDQQFLWMNYSVPKLFYLSVAQQFCSSEIKPGMAGIDFYENDILSNSLRINSIVMNSVHFSETFDCSVGSSMNPEIKVDQFPFIEQSQLQYI